MKTEFKTLLLEKKSETGIWLLTIQRPEALNALNSIVLSEMNEAVKNISELSFSEARVLVITGAGEKSFVAGADIKEIHDLTVDSGLIFAKQGQAVFQKLSELKIPVLAAVNGFALGGGCELALACDFIYASENAKFGLPETGLGLIPGFGGTVNMARAVGSRRAKELTFTGGMILAKEACDMGLVNKVFPLSDLMSAVMKTAELIIAKSPLGVAASKQSIHQAWDLDAPAAHENEAKIFANLFASQDVKEGTGAFIEKRKANFKGL